MWVGIIRSLFVLLVGVAVGFAIFGGLQYYLKPEFWISVAVAVLGALYTAISSMLDFVKKAYEIRKLHLEVRKLAREDQQAPSPNLLSPDEKSRMSGARVPMQGTRWEKEWLILDNTVSGANVLAIPEVQKVSRSRRIFEKLFGSEE